MLSWWRGPSEGDTGREDDGDDYPDTPAPVFAARALKSAIFGTPKLYDYDSAEVTRPVDISPSKQSREETIAKIDASRMSPTKGGILMTPGTAAGKRKSVTFGKDVPGSDAGTKSSKSGLPDDFPGKFPSPWVGPSSMRKTALTRTLENARTTKKATADTANENHESATTRTSSDNDFTEDLNYPHSESGKYWKAEYEKYHADATEEMRKLVRYKELAKTYAKNKDDEAYELGEKLLEEQQKVKLLEKRLEEMSIDGIVSDDIAQTKELARYKTMAERFKQDYEDLQEVISTLSPGKQLKFNSRTRISQADQDKGDGSKDARTEIRNLRLNLSTTERKVTRLQEEKKKMSEELIAVKKQLIRAERQRADAEEKCKARDLSTQALQDDYNKLRELAKSQRQDSEASLKRRQEQVAALRKEVMALRRQARTADSKTKVDTGILIDSEEDLITLQSPKKWDTEIGVLESRIDSKLRDAADFKIFDDEDKAESADDTDNARLLGDAFVFPTPKRLSTVPAPFKTQSKLRQSPGPLADSSNLRTGDQTGLDLSFPLDKGLGETPRLTRRALGPDDISLAVPSPSRSPVATKRQPLPSPRPSMVHLSTTPVKSASRPLSTSGDFELRKTPRSRTPKRVTGLAAGRARTSLPPERAAAALARLQQRNADKRKRLVAVMSSMEQNKENVQI